MPTDEAVGGLQALLESMDALPLVLQKKLIVRALRKGAEPIRRRAAELAPRDPTTPGNRVPDSITTTVRDQTATGAIAEIGPTKKGFAGIFAEGGTVKQRATPFLGPAFDQKQHEAYEVMAEVLGDGIEEEFEKRP